MTPIYIMPQLCVNGVTVSVFSLFHQLNSLSMILGNE